MGRLDGKVAIVTGGGGGIGRIFSLQLAAEGASVLVNDIGLRTGANAESVVDEIRAAGGKAAADVTSATWDGAGDIVQAAIDSFGRVDILFNNATAGGRPCNLWEMTEEGFDLSIDVNVKGYFAMIQKVALPFARQRSGVIVNMSSGAGFGHPSMVTYSASKEAVVGMTRAVARELGRFGIRCNALRPLALGISSGEYDVATAKWTNLILATTGGGKGKMPMAASATPETHPPAKIGPMGVWLCSDAAKNVNGRTFHVRGDTIALLNELGPEKQAVMQGGWTLEALDARADELVGGLANDFTLDEHPELQVLEESAS